MHRGLDPEAHRDVNVPSARHPRTPVHWLQGTDLFQFSEVHRRSLIRKRTAAASTMKNVDSSMPHVKFKDEFDARTASFRKLNEIHKGFQEE